MAQHHSNNTLGWRAAALALAIGTTTFLLAACGGGGGSSNDGAPIAGVGRPDEILVDNFVTTLATKGGSFQASSVDEGGRRIETQVVYRPGAPGWFLREETVRIDGVLAPTLTTTVNFSHAGNAFRVLSWMDEKLNTASQLRSTPLPEVVKPSSGANLFTADLVVQANGLNFYDVGRTHALRYDWSVGNQVAGLVDICLKVTETSEVLTKTILDCFQTDATASGTVYGFRQKTQLLAEHGTLAGAPR